MISGIGVVLPGIIGRDALAELSVTGIIRSPSEHRIRRRRSHPALSQRAPRPPHERLRQALPRRHRARVSDAGVENNAEFLESCSPSSSAARTARQLLPQLLQADRRARHRSPQTRCSSPKAFPMPPRRTSASCCRSRRMPDVIGAHGGPRCAAARLDAHRQRTVDARDRRRGRRILRHHQRGLPPLRPLSREPWKCGKRFRGRAGAVTLVLETRESLERRGGKALGRVELNSSRHSRNPMPSTRRSRYCTSARSAMRHQLFEQHLDRSLGIRRDSSSQWERENPSLYGQIAETYSVGPLAGIASALSGTQHESDSFGVLCTDYTGLVAGTRICFER